MHRLPPVVLRRANGCRLLLAVCVTAATAGVARAAEDTAGGRALEGRALAERATPVAEEAAPAPAPAPAQGALPSAARESGATLVAGAPLGSVDGKAEDKEGAFPLHAEATASNAFGTGLLAPGYQRQPNWSSSLDLNGSAGLPKVDFLPKMTLSTGVMLSVNNWLPAYTNADVYDRIVRAGNVRLGLGIADAFVEDFTQIKVGLGFSGVLPTAITSRQQNLLTTLGVKVPVGWTSAEQPWGQIGVSYALGGKVSLYSADAPTIPCEAGVAQGSTVSNPLENGDLPVQYSRTAEIGPNGDCLLVGRQGVASVTNTLGASWTLQGHSVQASLAWAVGFIRPLSSQPELSSPFASGQNFKETTTGNLAYSYEIPVDFPLSLSLGIGSEQAPYGSAGNVLFPFYDSVTPANNYSAAFVDVTIGI